MNCIRIAFSTFLLTMFLLPSLSFGQGNEGTIEASWNRPHSTPPPVERVVTPPPPAANADVRYMEYTKPAWDSKRTNASRPWPALSANPTVKEYFDVNTAVIDSLSHLYCLSSNYIGTLRIRNQQALQSKGPQQMRQFDYDGKPAPSNSGTPSLQVLHKELLQLLERCLVGR
ncbi:MAG: hypothetical protein IH600_11285 [Bacteroidetes bacterium]|nr:hypothetical protein [Bacteroidota bacterium]